MSTNRINRRSARSFPFVLPTLLMAVCAAAPVWAQPTAFTYQGQLKSGGSPANGAFDFSFSLFDAAANGTLIAGPLVFNGQGGNPPQISVASGLFTVELDFGAGVFDGNPRWLEITVSGTTLAPRQQLTSAPYSQTAGRAQSCAVADYANAPWVPSGFDLYYLGGNIGIGTSTPASTLDVIGTVKLDSLLMSTGAAAGRVLTSDGSGYGSWADPAGLTLPYSGLAAVDGMNLFALQNTGTGNGLSVQINSTINAAKAIVGTISSTTPGSSSVGVQGANSGTGSLGFGVWGSHAGSGTGVYGTAATSGIGVLGATPAGTGNGIGVYGTSNASSGYGLYGFSPNFGVYAYGGATGVYGAGATGVYGYSQATTGNPPGVQGYTANPTAGHGVHGYAAASTGDTRGVTGLNFSTGGIGVLGSAEATSGSTAGVWGQSSSPNGNGVTGFVSTGTSNAGVYGHSTALNGNGIIAEATNGSSAYALWAKASQGVGVRCDGALQVSGTKAFRIDHPFDPENKYLMHYCTESPEPLNTYTGNITTDAAGFAEVLLPGYFEEINKDFRYQLTVVDAGDDFVLAKVVRGVNRNSFRIRTSKPRVNVSWMVLATRNDRYVRTHGAPVEAEKPTYERGRYIDPSLYGQPPEKAQGYEAETTIPRMRSAAAGPASEPAAVAVPAALDQQPVTTSPEVQR